MVVEEGAAVLVLGGGEGLLYAPSAGGFGVERGVTLGVPLGVFLGVPLGVPFGACCLEAPLEGPFCVTFTGFACFASFSVALGAISSSISTSAKSSFLAGLYSSSRFPFF